MWAWTVSLTTTGRAGRDRATGVPMGVNAPASRRPDSIAVLTLPYQVAPADDPDKPGTRARRADHVARDRRDKRESQDPLASGDRSSPARRLEAARSLIFADAVAGALWLRPEGGEGQLGAQTPELNAFTSTEVPRATSTVETISGPKSPCSTTPAVPANCAARAAGSENATV